MRRRRKKKLQNGRKLKWKYKEGKKEKENKWQINMRKKESNSAELVEIINGKPNLKNKKTK